MPVGNCSILERYSENPAAHSSMNHFYDTHVKRLDGVIREQ